jgi:hypothetical protein
MEINVFSLFFRMVIFLLILQNSGNTMIYFHIFLLLINSIRQQFDVCQILINLILYIDHSYNSNYLKILYYNTINWTIAVCNNVVIFSRHLGRFGGCIKPWLTKLNPVFHYRRICSREALFPLSASLITSEKRRSSSHRQTFCKLSSIDFLQVVSSTDLLQVVNCRLDASCQRTERGRLVCTTILNKKRPPNIFHVFFDVRVLDLNLSNNLFDLEYCLLQTLFLLSHSHSISVNSVLSLMSMKIFLASLIYMMCLSLWLFVAVYEQICPCWYVCQNHGNMAFSHS